MNEKYLLLNEYAQGMMELRDGDSRRSGIPDHCATTTGLIVTGITENHHATTWALIVAGIIEKPLHDNQGFDRDRNNRKSERQQGKPTRIRNET